MVARRRSRRVARRPTRPSWDGPLVVAYPTEKISTVLDIVMRNAAQAPHDLAFEMDNEHLTWSELDLATSRIAHVLAGAGVGPGAVVALMAENSPFYMAAVLGASRVGATAALINSRSHSAACIAMCRALARIARAKRA